MNNQSSFWNKPQKRGFTLIELLVVIAIIGILATVSIVALNNARAKSRDSKRVSDVRQLSTALAMYYNDKGQYPMTLVSGQPLYSTSLDGSGNIVTTTYMSLVSTTPTPADGANCNTANNTLTYATSSDLQSYTLSTCVGNTPQNNQNAIYIADPVQIQPCGAYMVDYAGQKYQTVQIGTQCWMKSNLNVGTMVTSYNTAPCTDVNSSGNWACQTNNSSVEKYCLNNDSSTCPTYGGLYEWAEAMGFAYQCGDNSDFSSGSATCGTATTYTIATNHQGICPPGWHIPTDTQWNTLEQYLTDAGKTCNAARAGAWDCEAAGTKLQLTGTNNFGGQLTGRRYPNWGTFNDQNSNGDFWASTPNSTGYAYVRVLGTGMAGVVRDGTLGRINGVSVRCLKN